MALLDRVTGRCAVLSYICLLYSFNVQMSPFRSRHLLAFTLVDGSCCSSAMISCSRADLPTHPHITSRPSIPDANPARSHQYLTLYTYPLQIPHDRITFCMHPCSSPTRHTTIPMFVTSGRSNSPRRVRVGWSITLSMVSKAECDVTTT